MCLGPNAWSTLSGCCDRKECSHLSIAYLQKRVFAGHGDAFLILYLGLHILDDVTALHLQGDDLAGQFSQRFAFWSMSKCEDAMRIQSHIVISKAMHHHLTMPVISLVLVKGKPTRFWWIISGPRHTFQWIKTYIFLVAWESMNSYWLLIIPMGKTVLSLEQLLLVFLLRVQCRVTCRLQTWRKSLQSWGSSQKWIIVALSHWLQFYFGFGLPRWR